MTVEGHHPHLSEVLAHGESPTHLLFDHLTMPYPTNGRALTLTYARELVGAAFTERLNGAVLADRAHNAAVAKLNSIYSGQIPERVARDIAVAVLDAISRTTS